MYEKLVLRKPIITLCVLTSVIFFFGYHSRNFKLDASADSLVLENDQGINYYRSIRARYGSDDYLILTYTPKGELFSNPVLSDLKKLRHALVKIGRVDSVVSILDVPLINSPPVSLAELNDQVPTLEGSETDKTLARKEFLTSPLYRNLLISPDGNTTALQINFSRDETYSRLLEERNRLREKRLETNLTQEEIEELAIMSKRLKAYSARQLDQYIEDIATVRSIMENHREQAELHLGGVPMIVADSIAFIRHDLRVFGAGVLGFVIVLLTLIFRKVRWVVLPLLTCVATATIMLGLLGFLDWRVTIVSSNFLSLLLILTLSLTIHLIVRYRELQAGNTDYDQRALVRDMLRSKVVPCFYTALTTIVAFGSLVFSDIRPVIDFGWIMVMGISIAFVLVFTLFPSGLMLTRVGGEPSRRDFTKIITSFTADFIREHGKKVLLAFGVLTVISVMGMTRLSVENRFIDYFKESTEIYQGMLLIDQKLGGTTPLDVIIDAPQDWIKEEEPELSTDPFEENANLGSKGSGGITSSSYWFNSIGLKDVAAIHTYLESLSETGKVLSLHTTMSLLKQLRDDQSLDDFFLSILYKRLPDKIQQTLFSPYLSDDGNQIRFSVRVFESDRTLQRQALLEKIRRYLVNEIGLAEEQIHFTGMMVLYNNMLQSLFRSQVLTLIVVFIAILLMFMILFRAFGLASLAVVPNVLAATFVLGLMGWARIPLDIMTITIAAISIGIAVDDTIHYVHRFNTEFRKDGDYWKAIKRSHDNIGRALFYTTLTISLGFSIMTMSNFVPTIYFGVLTGFAMIVALLADLTLLPLFIAKLKPRIV